jgi:hypothetical protein
MLQVISPLKGFTIKASDGGVGTVVDFLFDDRSWKVRWLVIDCGGAVTPTWIGAARGLEDPLNFRPRWRLATSGTLRLLGREACGGM